MQAHIFRWRIPTWMACLGLLVVGLGIGGIVQAVSPSLIPCAVQYCPSGTNGANLRPATQADVGYGWYELTQYAPGRVYAAVSDLCANSPDQPQVIVLNADQRKPSYRWTCRSLDQLGQTVIVIRKGQADNYELTAEKSDAINPDGIDLICNFRHELDLDLYFQPEAVKAYVAGHCRSEAEGASGPLRLFYYC